MNQKVDGERMKKGYKEKRFAIGVIYHILAGHGTFGGTYDIVHYRYGGNENLLDLRSIPNAPVVDGTVFILSGLLAGNDPAAGGMFLFCQKESTQHHAAGRTVISGRFSGVKVPG